MADGGESASAEVRPPAPAPDGDAPAKSKKPAASASATVTAPVSSEAADDPLLAAALLGAKKRRKRQEGDTAAPATAAAPAPSKPVDDIRYEQYLRRIYESVRKLHPGSSESRVVTIPHPTVSRDGPKKSAFVNFQDVCRALSRPPEHVIHFIYAELQTNGDVDGDGHLILKGRFNGRQLEDILRRYIKDYVLCIQCKSPDTTLERDSHSRTTSINCSKCKAQRNVSQISSGYHAVVVKRRLLRQAAGAS